MLELFIELVSFVIVLANACWVVYTVRTYRKMTKATREQLVLAEARYRASLASLVETVRDYGKMTEATREKLVLAEARLASPVETVNDIKGNKAGGSKFRRTEVGELSCH